MTVCDSSGHSALTQSEKDDRRNEPGDEDGGRDGGGQRGGKGVGSKLPNSSGALVTGLREGEVDIKG